MTASNAYFHRIGNSPWFPRSVSLVLIILISWWSYDSLLPLLDPDMPTADSVATAAATPASAPAYQLQDLNLFGSVQPAASVTTAPVVATKLELTLRGVLATDNPQQGYAQIENNKKQEKNFRVEDSVFGLATLKEIYIDRVIILHDGNYETLLLPEEFLNTKHFEAAKLKQQQKKIVTDFRKLLVNRRGMELIKLFGFDTAYKNGSFIGFVVRGLGDEGRKMMATLGVEEGDIVVAVNGENLSQSIQAVNNLAKLKTASKVNIEIDRGGNRLFFDFDFDNTVPVVEPDEDEDALDELVYDDE
jgi:general secretion pathway protein C